MATKRTPQKSPYAHVEDPEFRAFLEAERADEEAAYAGTLAPFDDSEPLALTPLPAGPAPAAPPTDPPPTAPSATRRHRAKAASPKERAEGYRARRTAAGLVQVAYWICATDRDQVERAMTKFTARGRGQYRRWERDQMRAEKERTEADRQQNAAAPASSSEDSKFFPNVMRGLAANVGYEVAAEMAERTITGSMPANPTSKDRWRLCIELMLALDAVGDGASRSHGEGRHSTDRRMCAWMVKHKVSKNLAEARRWLDTMRSKARHSDLLIRWRIGEKALVDDWYDTVITQIHDEWF